MGSNALYLNSDMSLAGGHGSPRVQLRHDSASLTAWVVFVSEMSCITPSAYSDAQWPNRFKGAAGAAERARFFKEAWALADKIPSPYRSTGQPPEEALWRTIIQDRRWAGGKEGQSNRPASPELGVFFVTHRRKLFTKEGSDDTASGRMQGLDPEVDLKFGQDYFVLCSWACRAQICCHRERFDGSRSHRD